MQKEELIPCPSQARQENTVVEDDQLADLGWNMMMIDLTLILGQC
jgi:hypothetical protein